MPSLSELQKFKASFGDIGREKADLAAKKIPYDDLELPDSEPVAPTTPDDMGFDAFLGAQPDDLPEPPAPIIPEIDEAQESSTEPDWSGEGSPLDLDSLDNFDLPEDMGNIDDLGNLDDFNLPDEGIAAESALPSTEGAAEELDLGNLDDFNLPDEGISAESALPATEDAAEENFDLGSIDDLGLPDESSAEPDWSDESSPLAEPPSAEENLDLDNLDDFNLPDETASAESALPATEDAAEESFDLGSIDDLGLPAEPSSEPDWSGEDSPLAEPSPAEENLDLDNLDDFNLPDEGIAADSGAPLDLGSIDDLGLPDESSAEPDWSDEGSPLAEPSPAEENLDLGNFDDFNLPDEAASSSAEDITDSGESENIDISNFDDFNIPTEPASPDEVESVDLFDESAMADGDEIVDMENIDDIGLPDDSAAEESQTIDDFSFPELDNVLKRSQEKVAVDKTAKSAKKGKLFGKPKRPVRTEKAPDDVDEIHLSDDELEALLETLSRYPLNLRIACEEIISEHAVNPKQMSELIEHLVWGATAKETAIVAGRILGKTIHVPKAFEKSSGAALEAEQASFAYIFVHNFLPVLRLIMFIAVVAASIFYLTYKFIYIPLKAESIYKMGYERIFDGEYQRANERFTEAFNIHRKKVWFYRYAEAFRDERQYIYAEQKYDELLRYYTRDKKGVLDYAYLETYYLRNYAKADTILRHQLLDYAPDDPEGLLAAGDNCLLWGDIEPSKYEDARYHYARLLEKYGWKAPVVERMMKYFIRTDNLKETLILKNWFDRDPQKRPLSAESLGELGGYLLDKQLEEARGVPNEYIEYIDGVRDLLLRAVYADASLPEPHYHLARYYNHLGNTHEERVTLRIAVDRFEKAPEGSIRRLHYHIDALQRYADVLINAREFMPAEEQLIKGINLYEDGLARRLLSSSPQYGRLYAGLGDLEYFTKVGDMEAALRYYRRSEQNGYAPPEMQYRMGAAYYQLEDWKNALEYLFAASSSLPLNRRILFALGNTALKRGDYFAAQGYYNRLLDILENQRSRLPVLLPNDRPEYLELAERLMMARNNAGVASEMLGAQTGNRTYHTRAMALYAEANRAWDSLTRDPLSMIRSSSTPLAYLNSRNSLYPQPGYEPQIFIRIDQEALETSPWEDLAPLARLDHGRSN